MPGNYRLDTHQDVQRLKRIVALKQQQIQLALVTGMSIGFSHAPIAKRQLMCSGVPFITLEGTIGGGLLAATTLSALVESLIAKPDCHCY